jgi:hypothetical protein
MLRRALAVLLLLLCGCAAHPDAGGSADAGNSTASAPPLTPPTTDREKQADYAMSLFMDACVAHVASPANLTKWILERGLRRLEPEVSSRILAGETGQVWSAGSELGHFFLIVVPINPTVNKCSVWAHRADATRLNGHFERLLKGTARPGLSVSTVSDAPIQGPGGAYRQLIYYIVKDGAELGWVFVATTSPSEEAEIQGRLMVSPGKEDQILAPGSPEKLEPSQSP